VIDVASATATTREQICGKCSGYYYSLSVHELRKTSLNMQNDRLNSLFTTRCLISHPTIAG